MVTPSSTSSDPLGIEVFDWSCNLASYRPETAWYLSDPNGIHGVAHSARVLVWAEVLGQRLSTKIQQVNMHVLRWSAVCHDLRRFDDSRDQLHGARACQWVQASLPSLTSPLSEPQLRAVARNCLLHAADLSRLGAGISIELACLRDADALDHVRLGYLDSDRLIFDEARGLVRYAVALWEQTGHLNPGEAAWDRTLEMAQKLRLETLFVLEDEPTPSSGGGLLCLVC